jgi:hypothetical protein
MKKVDWDTIKTWYVQGEQGKDGLRYPSLEEVADKGHRNASSVRQKASKEKWAELRNLFKSKTENLTLERKSLIMAGASAEFDSQCLDAARKGIQLVNEVLNAIITQRPTGKDIKETIAWVEDRNDSIKELGKALNDYQKAGKLAFGENTEADKDITINVKYDDK